MEKIEVMDVVFKFRVARVADRDSAKARRERERQTGQAHPPKGAIPAAFAAAVGEFAGCKSMLLISNSYTADEVE